MIVEKVHEFVEKQLFKFQQSFSRVNKNASNIHNITKFDIKKT